MTNIEAIEYGKEQLEIFGGKHAEFIRMAIEALSAQPEIIRCKDCTRFELRGCNLVEGLNVAKADCFCSYAERRTDETD